MTGPAGAIGGTEDEGSESRFPSAYLDLCPGSYPGPGFIWRPGRGFVGNRINGKKYSQYNGTLLSGRVCPPVTGRIKDWATCAAFGLEA